MGFLFLDRIILILVTVSSIYLLLYTKSKHFSIPVSIQYSDKISSSSYSISLVRNLRTVLLTWFYGELLMSLLDWWLFESQDWVFFTLVSFQSQYMCVTSVNQRMNELQKSKPLSGPASEVCRFVFDKASPLGYLSFHSYHHYSVLSLDSKTTTDK